MLKQKPKGTPGRREQNLLFMAGGLLAGIIGTIVVVVLLLNRPIRVEQPPTPVPSMTASYTPTLIPSLTASYTPTATLPPTNTPAPVVFSQLPPTPTPLAMPIAITQPNPVRAIAVAPNNSLLAIAYEADGHGYLDLRRLDIQNGHLFGDATQLAENLRVDRLAFSPTGDKLVAMTDSENAVVIYNVATRLEMERFIGQNRAAFTPDGTWLLVGGGAGNIMMLNAATLDLNSIIEVHGFVHDIAATWNGRIALAEFDETRGYGVSVIDLYQSNLVALHLPTDAPVHEVEFSPNGNQVVLSIGPMVLITDMVSMRQIPLDMSYMGHAWALAFSPDSTWLAAAGGVFSEGYATGAYVWNYDSSVNQSVGEGVLESRYLAGHTHDVKSLVFTPDGRYVITASTDGTIRAWDYAGAGMQMAFESA